MNTYTPVDPTINCMTGARLMRCKHCKAAEDSAKLLKTKCSASNHSFTELYVPRKARNELL